MIDIAAFSKRMRRRARMGSVLFVAGAFMLVMGFAGGSSGGGLSGYGLMGALLMGLGVVLYWGSLEQPRKEIVQLAETRNGLLTVTEITTALDTDPGLVIRALKRLQAQGLARPCWQEWNKNLWEFPDCTHLPIAETIQLARESGGRIELQDLIAAGHSVEIAQQTFAVLASKGIAQDDTTAATPSLTFPGGNGAARQSEGKAEQAPPPPPRETPLRQ